MSPTAPYRKHLLRSVCYGLICLTSLAYPSLGSNSVDHLVPTTGIVTPAYAKLLHRKLYLTSANYVRMVILPSTGSKGERVFSLHSTKADTDRVVVTYTWAESNLWSEASDANLALTIEPRAKIRRLDVPLPKSLAVAISETIRKMILESRKPSGTGPVVVDGTDFLFSTQAVGQYREAILMAGSTGKNVTRLVRLLELLDRYCNAKEENRGRLVKEIEVNIKGIHLR